MANIIDSYVPNTVCIGDFWFLSKPLTLFSIRRRINDAVGVLFGKYTAVYFKEDIIKEK